MYKLLGGTQQISETLAQELHTPVAYNRNVVQISQGEDSITVRALDPAFGIITCVTQP